MNDDNWVGLIVEGGFVSVLAVRGRGAKGSVTARQVIEFDPAASDGDGLPELGQFVSEHSLARCDAHILFEGAGTVVQTFTLPAMNVRNRARAIKMRLVSHAGSSDLTTDWLSRRRGSRKDGLSVLAAGVDRRICEGLYLACLRSGLRVRSAMPLAAAFACPPGADNAVQLVMGERNTTIQVFEDGRLHTCRDTPIGRRDLIDAYQRPILSGDGPITLSPEQAEQMLSLVGVPCDVEADDVEVAPGTRASQLWPILSPTLQRFRDEVRQTIAHSGVSPDPQRPIVVVSLPQVPGLASHLAAELDLTEADSGLHEQHALFLAGVLGKTVHGHALDLLPLDVRRTKKLARPALGMSIAALLILTVQLNAPHTAEATVSRLHPVNATLQHQLERLDEQFATAMHSYTSLTAELAGKRELLAVVPEQVRVVTALKALCNEIPETMALVEVHVRGVSSPVTLTCIAEYRGEQAASVAVTQLAKRLSRTPFFANASVTSITGGGHDGSALLAFDMQVRP